MGKLATTNCKEYLLKKFALCGELNRTGIPKTTPYSAKHVQTTLKELDGRLTEKALISPYEYMDRKNFYRLRKRNGIPALQSIDAENVMYNHYCLLVGTDERRNTGGKKQQLKQRKLYEVCALFASSNFEIDLLSLDETAETNSELDRTVFKSYEEQLKIDEESAQAKENGEKITEENILKSKMRSTSDVLREIKPDIPCFITSKVLRNYFPQGISLHSRILMFKSLGILFSGTQVYSIYNLVNGAEEVWYQDVETQYANVLQRLSKENLKSFANLQNAVFRTKAIVYVPNKIEYFKLMTEEKLKIDPPKSYGLSYYVPLQENAKEITEMLLLKEWRFELDEVLENIFSCKLAESGDLEDGWMQDGTGMFNLLCGNIKHMKHIQKRVRSIKTTIICHDWMVPTVEEMYGNDINIIPISEEFFSKLLQAVKLRVEAKNS